MPLQSKPSQMPNKPESTKPTDLPEWSALRAHHTALKNIRIADLFDADPSRFNTFHRKLKSVLFDYSKHLVTRETLDLLCALARICDIEGQRDTLFSATPINTSENRAVLHTALRGSVDDALSIDGENIADFVSQAQEKIKTISQSIRANPAITDVVTIGIGGSEMGPRMVCDALRRDADGPHIHFISNIDGDDIDGVLRTLAPEKTAFIIASKTFTTLETIANAKYAKAWCNDDTTQFYATTQNQNAARDFGITDENILPLRNWIGGRYSVWGAIGLPIAVSLGFESFQNFLDGAKAADTHFRQEPLEQNIPVLMAVLGIWYNNFYQYPSHAIIPYAQALDGFPGFIQQLDMESNGKHVDAHGHAVSMQTGPIVFGGTGTNAQHAFFQHLHQSTHITPVDFIAIINPKHKIEEHHTKLLANALAQSQALMLGQENAPEPHRNFEGNRPSTTFLLDRLDPFTLGMLMALYEYKIFVQGVIWGINSFDQWGVELGKALADNITQSLKEDNKINDIDSSTAGLITHILKNS